MKMIIIIIIIIIISIIPTAQANKGICSALILICFILIIVDIKFTAPRIDDTPAT
jgi:hypothetical protein